MFLLDVKQQPIYLLNASKVTAHTCLMNGRDEDLTDYCLNFNFVKLYM